MERLHLSGNRLPGVRVKGNGMKLQKDKINIKKLHDQNDDNFVDASPAERIACMWDLTVEIWSLKERKHVESRLQRHITNIIRK